MSKVKRIFQSLTYNNATTMKSLERFPRNLCKDFFLKIGIHSAKVFAKNFPNIDVCVLHPCSAQNSVYQAILINTNRVFKILFPSVYFNFIGVMVWYLMLKNKQPKVERITKNVSHVLNANTNLMQQTLPMGRITKYIVHTVTGTVIQLQSQQKFKLGLQEIWFVAVSRFFL